MKSTNTMTRTSNSNFNIYNASEHSLLTQYLQGGGGGGGSNLYQKQKKSSKYYQNIAPKQ